MRKRRKISQKFADLQVKRSTVAFSVGIALLGLPFTTQATENTQNTELADVQFDPIFLAGGEAETIDVSRFSHPDSVPAGTYNVDIFVNGKRKGRMDLHYQQESDSAPPVLCLDKTLITLLDLKSEAYLSDGGDCPNANTAVPEGKFTFDLNRLELNLDIPQALTVVHPRGYIAPSQWEQGVPAAFVNYDANQYHYYMGDNHATNSYFGIHAGVNLGSWAFRHSGSQTWIRTNRNYDYNSHYQRNETYIQRNIAQICGQLTLGDFTTKSLVMDSIGLHGVSIASDDRMLPSSQRGYAPVVQGVANSNARITIRQNGNIIYQTIVPPGAFSITDLYPTGSSGDLQVEILEANGETRSFVVPFAQLAPLVRKGQWRYQLATGKFRYNQQISDEVVTQGALQYGVTNSFTLNTGINFSKNYQSGLLGFGLNTPIGAFSVDGEMAQAKLRHLKETKKGYSIHASYSVKVPRVETNITLAAYRYSSRNYWGLSETLWGNQRENANMRLVAASDRPKHQYQLLVSQDLGDKWGSIYLAGSTNTYWNKKGTKNEYQFSYSNHFKGVNYQITFSQAMLDYDQRDNRLSVSFSLPFRASQSNSEYLLTVNHNHSNRGYSSSQLGLSGSSGEYNQMSYGVSGSRGNDGYRDVSAYGNYRGTFGEVRLNASRDNEDNKQWSIGLNGSLVVHPKGITLGNQVGDTFGVIHANGGYGALINNGLGNQLDWFGNGIVPYLTPYSINDMSIDPQNLAANVQLSATSQEVIPEANSVAMVEFTSNFNSQILFNLHLPDGNLPPLAAEAYDDEGNLVGYVVQGGALYAMQLKQNQGNIYVVWGKNSNEQCHFTYNVDNLLTEHIQHFDVQCVKPEAGDAFNGNQNQIANQKVTGN